MANRANLWHMQPWDESAGYDCITPGIEIQDALGHTVCVIDAKDYGWNLCGLGSGVAAHREKVHRQVYDTADSIVKSHNELCGGRRLRRPVRPAFRGVAQDRQSRRSRFPRLSR